MQPQDQIRSGPESVTSPISVCDAMMFAGVIYAKPRVVNNCGITLNPILGLVWRRPVAFLWQVFMARLDDIVANCAIRHRPVKTKLMHPLYAW